MDVRLENGHEPLREAVADTSPFPVDSQGAKPREAVWDNVKAVCVLLVVICHTLAGPYMAKQAGGQQPDPADPAQMGNDGENITPATLSFGSAFLAITVVVMPALSFVSGHLSSRQINTPHRVRALLQLGLTAFIQQVLWGLLQSTKAPLPINVYGAMGVQWYIVCLLFWRLTLPFWMILRFPLAASIVVGTLALLADASNFNFHSFLSFLPFFIAGHMTSRKTLKSYRRPAGRAAFFFGVALAAAAPTLLMLFVAEKDKAEIANVVSLALTGAYMCFNFESPLCGMWFSIPMRLLYYLIAVPLIPAFLALIPDRKVWGLTRAGIFSMYIYLLHIWLVMLWIVLAASGRLQGGSFFLGSMLYAFAIWALLGTGCARPCCRCCVEPRIDCLVQPWLLEDWARDRPVPVGDAVAVAEA